MSRPTCTLPCPKCKEDMTLEGWDFEVSHECEHCGAWCYLNYEETPDDEGGRFWLELCLT